MANGAGTLAPDRTFPPPSATPETAPEAIDEREPERKPGRIRAKLSSSAVWLAGKTRPHIERAVSWRIALPGLAGAGLISAGIALRFGTWAGLIAAGLFLLRIDSRIR